MTPGGCFLNFRFVCFLYNLFILEGWGSQELLWFFRPSKVTMPFESVFFSGPRCVLEELIGRGFQKAKLGQYSF